MESPNSKTRLELLEYIQTKLTGKKTTLVLKDLRQHVEALVASYHDELAESDTQIADMKHQVRDSEESKRKALEAQRKAEHRGTLLQNSLEASHRRHARINRMIPLMAERTAHIVTQGRTALEESVPEASMHLGRALNDIHWMTRERTLQDD